MAWRAQLAGYKVWYEPRAIVYHHLSATGGGVTASFYDGRNGIWLVAKNMPASLLRKYARPILGRQLALLWLSLKSWRGQEARARIRGMIAGALHIRGALAKRKRIQAAKRVTDDYIESILTAGLSVKARSIAKAFARPHVQLPNLAYDGAYLPSLIKLLRWRFGVEQSLSEHRHTGAQ